MKKFLLIAVAAFGMLMTACSKDEVAQPVGGEESVVTFTVEAPVMATRALGDGTTATQLFWAVYDKNHNLLFQSSEVTVMSGLTATVEIPFVNGMAYNILFWAEAEQSPYSVDWANLKVGYKNQTLVSNSEKYDAFYCYFTELGEITGPVNEDVELKRPFAQLNIITNDATEAAQSGLTVDQVSVEISEGCDQFNFATGEGIKAAADKKITFTNADKLANDHLAVNYLFTGGEKSLVNVTFAYTDGNLEKGGNASGSMEFASVPVQRNYRTNIVGSLLTSDGKFNIEIKPGFDGNHEVNNVTTQTNITNLLKVDEEHIVLNLMGAGTRSQAEPTTYYIDIAANSESYYLGTAKTKSITINANDNIVNFVHNNTDWNYVRCVNPEAKIIINDATLTNSKNNNGPWNRHDICFFNPVELNNIVSDKAIALKADATLNNIDISDVHPDGSEAYALWITAEGQTVNIKDAEFIAHSSKSTDRGIKIANQYIDNPAKVTLNIEDAVFETQKKAAILVTSQAGADITLKNVDITDVAADNFHAVWVDEEMADYADLVTVTGGHKMVEGKEETSILNGILNEMATEGATVNLPANTNITLPNNVADGVTIIGAEGSVINVGGKSITSDNVTIKGVTFQNDGNNETPISLSGKNPTLEDCVFLGAAGNGNGVVVAGNGDSDNVITLKNCDFSQDDFFKPIFDGWSGLDGGTLVIDGCTLANGLYAMHIDANGESGKIVVKNSTVSGFTTNGASLDSISFENCVFGEDAGYACVNLFTSHSFINCTFPTKADANNVGNYGLYVSSKAKGDAMVMDNCKMSDGTPITKDNVAVANGGFLHWDSDTEACQWTLNGECITLGQGYTLVDGYTALYTDVNGTYCLMNKQSLIDWHNFLAAKPNVNPYNKVFKLLGNIDAEGYTWQSINGMPDATTFVGLVLDGQGYTISNLNVTGEGMLNLAPAGSVFKNVTFDGVTSTSEGHNAAIIWGSVYSNASFENVHIKNSTVTGLCNVGTFVGGTYEPNNLVVSFKDCSVEGCQITANGYGSQDPTGASGFIGKAYGASKLVFEGENSIDAATTITNNNGLVGGRVYGYTLWQDGGWKGTGASDSFVNWAGLTAVVSADSYEDVGAAGEVIAAGEVVTFESNVQGAVANSNGYGSTGLNVTGGIIDGNGNTLTVTGANATWDSAINITGGTIKNLTINSGFRGIFINHNSTECSKVYLDNVTIDGPVYTISCDQGTNKGLEAKNSTFNGWTSYANTIGEVSFTNCQFGKGQGYAFCRPYAPTTFVGCNFEAGFAIDARAAVIFENCTLNGEALTSENIASLMAGGADKVTLR